MKENRLKRINSEIQKAAYSAINKLTSDKFPGVLISITKVETTDDLTESKISLSIYSVQKEFNINAVLSEIKNKVSQIREIVAHSVAIRRMPLLKFELDDSYDKAKKIESLLMAIKKEDEKN